MSRITSRMDSSSSPSSSLPSIPLLRRTTFYSHPSDPAKHTVDYPDKTHLTFFDKERGYVRRSDLLALIPALNEKEITLHSVVVETLQNTGGTYVAEMYRLPVY